MKELIGKMSDVFMGMFFLTILTFVLFSYRYIMQGQDLLEKNKPSFGVVMQTVGAYPFNGSKVKGWQVIAAIQNEAKANYKNYYFTVKNGASEEQQKGYGYKPDSLIPLPITMLNYVSYDPNTFKIEYNQDYKRQLIYESDGMVHMIYEAVDPNNNQNN